MLETQQVEGSAMVSKSDKDGSLGQNWRYTENRRLESTNSANRNGLWCTHLQEAKSYKGELRQAS